MDRNYRNTFSIRMLFNKGSVMRNIMMTLLLLLVVQIGYTDVLIEESFETDLSGGTGLGAWTTNNVDRWAQIWYPGDGSAVAGWPDPGFAGLATSGGWMRRENALGSAGISSAIDGSVDLVTPGTIYFSALIEANNGVIDNHNAALSLGSGIFDNPGGGTGTTTSMMTAGEGIGFGLNGDSLFAYSYAGGVGTESAGSIALTGATVMIVGEITWGATEDTLNLYNIADVSAPLPAAFATVTGTLDESLFDTLALGDRRQTSFDEIRVGTEVGDVLVPEPATMVLLGLGGLVLRRRRK